MCLNMYYYRPSCIDVCFSLMQLTYRYYMVESRDPTWPTVRAILAHLYILIPPAKILVEISLCLSLCICFIFYYYSKKFKHVDAGIFTMWLVTWTRQGFIIRNFAVVNPKLHTAAASISSRSQLDWDKDCVCGCGCDYNCESDRTGNETGNAAESGFCLSLRQRQYIM